MTTEKMFVMAAKNKFRFAFKGLITTEDLFDLTMENLDVVYRALMTEKKKASEESLLGVKTKSAEVLAAKIGIVEYVFNMKKEEKEKKVAARERKERNEQIKAILADRQNEALKSMPTEELAKLIEEDSVD